MVLMDVCDGGYQYPGTAGNARQQDEGGGDDRQYGNGVVRFL